MAASDLYASFIVRLWHEPPAEGTIEPVWMGELESIQTGRAWRFQGLERLLPLLAAQLAGSPPIGHGGVEEN